MAAAVHEKLHERVMGWKKDVNDWLHEKNCFTDTLEKVEKKTGVDRLYIFSGGAGVFSIYMVLGYWAQLVCNFIGFVYPSYRSVKAIESSDKDDDTKWLTYWVVFAYFSVIEFFVDIVLSWFPVYWLVKVAFLVWCMAPFKRNGAHVIYENVIKPFIKRREKGIDSTIDEIKEAAEDTLSSAAEKMSDVAKEVKND